MNKLEKAILEIKPHPRKTWFDDLAVEVQKELLHVRQRYSSGGYATDATTIWVAAKKLYAIKCSVTTFRSWLKDGQTSKRD